MPDQERVPCGHMIQAKYAITMLRLLRLSRCFHASSHEEVISKKNNQSCKEPYSR